MLRLFVGLEIPENIKREIAVLQGGLDGAFWHTPDKLNLNLRFIGNVEEPVADEIVKELRYIRFPAFYLSLKEINFFSTKDIPHHLWTGVDSTKVIAELQHKIDLAVKKAGAGNSDRFKFVPHVSLARLQGVQQEEMFRYIAEYNLFHSSEFLVDSFSLFSSHARDNGEGKYYTIEETFPLNLV